jgi:RNA polymerase subunit RPABC4/transcription elongation factor Spt4
MHCSEMIERDSRSCPKCGSRSPFGYQCPKCLKSIGKDDAVCSGCGRSLTTTCPLCGGSTFAGNDKCDACGRSLLVLCKNKKCGVKQYFENTTCTACGKPIKKAVKQLEKEAK